MLAGSRLLVETVPLARAALSADSPLLRRLGVAQLSRALQASFPPVAAHDAQVASSAASAGVAAPSVLLVEVLGMLRDADTGTAAAAQAAIVSVASRPAGKVPVPWVEQVLRCALRLMQRRTQ